MRHTRAFTLLIARGAADYPRLGLVVAKRKIRRATVRNRVKRIVRESFRRVAANLINADVIVIAKEAAAGLSNAELTALLVQEWGKLRRPEVRDAQPDERARLYPQP